MGVGRRSSCGWPRAARLRACRRLTRMPNAPSVSSRPAPLRPAGRGRWPGRHARPALACARVGRRSDGDDQEHHCAGARHACRQVLCSRCVRAAGGPTRMTTTRGPAGSVRGARPVPATPGRVLRAHVIPDDELSALAPSVPEQPAQGATSTRSTSSTESTGTPGLPTSTHSGAQHLTDPLAPDPVGGPMLIEDGAPSHALAGGHRLTREVVVISTSAYGSPGILLRRAVRALPRRRAGTGSRRSQSCRSAKALRPRRTEAAWRPSGATARRDSHARGRARRSTSARWRWPSRAARASQGVIDLFISPRSRSPEISGAAFAMKPFSRRSVRLN